MTKCGQWLARLIEQMHDILSLPKVLAGSSAHEAAPGRDCTVTHRGEGAPRNRSHIPGPALETGISFSRKKERAGCREWVEEAGAGSLAREVA